MSFPADFVWGAAAASYQIEGGWQADGKGLSVWDVFAHRPDTIYNGDTGDVACDHYHRYQDDVALMQEIGLQAYRFSLSWPRILPEGTGAINPAGLDFYDKLVDTLLAAHIQPYATLFHWDLPYALYLRGGWKNRDIADWFADYTTIVVEKLGDRVKHWMPLNEPVVFLLIGHREGRHAPGDKVCDQDFVYMMHNMFLTHGKAVQAIRAASPGACKVGSANAGAHTFPATESEADIEAARQAMFSPHNPWSQGWWSDPMMLGQYPDDTSIWGGYAIPVQAGDMEIIRQPLDFFGFNVYQGVAVRAGENGLPEVLPRLTGSALTLTQWPVTPEVLHWPPRFYYDRYHLPILISENGLSLPDWVALDGKVHDPGRIDFVGRYLRAYKQAAAAGVPLVGYMHWSIMDNFEWAEGMKHRFGLIHVDYQTLKRTLKDSAYWYKDVIASNGANL
ncbi:MAG: beta-glucosidase [Anaerolineae bacterium]|nr:beta-glucosidase [Anaerolineae bacterium]